jgi:hypothetical protein
MALHNTKKHEVAESMGTENIVGSDMSMFPNSQNFISYKVVGKYVGSLIKTHTTYPAKD